MSAARAGGSYTSWSGTSSPLLDPKNPNRTMFFYAGGDGPHDGQRDDSIGLAYAPTHAYAGLSSRRASVTTKGRQISRLRTAVLQLGGETGRNDNGSDNRSSSNNSSSAAGGQSMRWEVLAALRRGDKGTDLPSLRARFIITARFSSPKGASVEKVGPYVKVTIPTMVQGVEDQKVGPPHWVQLPSLSSLSITSGEQEAAQVSWEFECDGGTNGACSLFALRCTPVH